MKYHISTHYLDYPLKIGRVFDLFEPETVSKTVAIFIVHGGGWRHGSRTAFHKIMEAFCEQGFIVASADYRLDARDAFCQLKDIREAYDKFVSILKEKNRPVKIAVYGESAGAHLASLLVCAKPEECGETVDLENKWITPYAGILQSTPVSFIPYESMMPSVRAVMESIAGAPYEKDPDRYERLSLKNYINDKKPPVFFLEADREDMFMPEYTLEIVKKHRKYGINSQWKIYKDMEHGFFFELKRNAQKEAFNDICAFLDGTFVSL